MESGPLSEPAFAEFAASVVLFLHNTSRVDDEPYPQLLREKGLGGFPSLVFLDENGDVLAKPGQRTVAAFAATRDRIDAWRAAAAAVKAGKAGADGERKLFLAELDLGRLSADAIRQRMGTLTLGERERAQVDEFLVDAEVRELQAKARDIGPEKVGEQVAAIAAAGRRPSQDGALQFWALTLSWAAKTRNAELAQRAHDELKRLDLPPQMKQRAAKLLEDAKAKG